jgi:hypothetical protein
MKRVGFIGVIVLTFGATAVADTITFSITFGGPGSLTASATGLTAGPAMNFLVSDSTKSIEFPLPGTFTASAGPAIFFVPISGLVIAAYSPGGPNSVLINDSSSHPLFAGSMSGNDSFLADVPFGLGTFTGGLNVTFVSPAVLAMFKLSPNVRTTSSVFVLNFGDHFDGTTVSGAVGSGAVTIETAAAPEPSGVGLLGTSLLMVAENLRRRRASRTPNS